MAADHEGLLHVQKAWRAFIQQLDRPPEPKYGPGHTITRYSAPDPTPAADPILLEDGTVTVVVADEMYVSLVSSRLNSASRELLDEHFGSGAVTRFEAVTVARGLRVLAAELARVAARGS